MWFKHRAWIPVAWLAAALNVAAVWFAARPAEPFHATGHALLAVLLALGARHLTDRRRSATPSADLQQALDEGERLQQTIDAMHPRIQELEERLDFTERLLAQQRDVERIDPPRP
jgi:membrane protein implicated in regulation of membrane protease activity